MHAAWSRSFALLLLLLAGCVDVEPDDPPTTSPTAGTTTSSSATSATFGPCEKRNAPASGNAPRLPAFQGAFDEVRARVATALSEPRRDNVTVSSAFIGEGVNVRYEAHRVWPALDQANATRELDRFFRALVGNPLPGFNRSYFPAGQSGYAELKPRWKQTFADGEIGVLGLDTWQYGSGASMQNRTAGTIGPLYDLKAARATVSRDRATDVAVTHLACSDPDKPGRFRPPAAVEFGISADSVVHRVETFFQGHAGHHCGGDRYTVYVDAVTEKVHAEYKQPCI